MSTPSQVWRETLERSGRLHDISAALDQLKRIGVRRVCWLRPNEEVTPHEGVWANGGFAFFYDDPSFDCVFKLSKVIPNVLKLASWERHSSLPWGGLSRLRAALRSRVNGRATQGPLAHYTRLTCGREARPNSLTSRPSPSNPGDATVTARQPSAAAVVRRPSDCRVRNRGQSADPGSKRGIGTGRAMLLVPRRGERRQRS